MKHLLKLIACLSLLHPWHTLPRLTKKTSSAEKSEHETTQSTLDLAKKCLSKHEYAQAIQILDSLIAQEPRNATYHFHRANALTMSGRPDEALAIYHRLLTYAPDNTAINYHIAFTLKMFGRIDEAMPYYAKTLEQDPNHVEANFSLGLAHLANGNFIPGFEGYEWRLKRPQLKTTVRSYQEPLWDGSALDGKRIFLYAEQGLGDTFQFIRYAREAKKHGGHVTVAVQKPLVTILAKCPYIDEVISLTQPAPTFDVHAPLMSLPYILKTSIDTVPNDTPYIYAEDKLVNTWHEKMAHDKNFKIGICWQGNKLLKNPFFKSRAIQCAQLCPLSSIPNVSIYSLQQRDGIDQIAKLEKAARPIIFEENFDDAHGRFMDTAAVMKNLDLVITVDTSVAHLAAGLGVPTWIMLPKPADWRWMHNRSDTPWYPTVRLFRQTTAGEWDPVIQTMVQEIMVSDAYQQKVSTLQPS